MTVSETFDALQRYVERADYSGYDPYDALNSPVLNALSRPNKWLRIAAIQFMRRSPINIRPLLLTSRGHNPKALGLFLEGYVHLSPPGDSPYREQIDRLLGLLGEVRSQGYTGSSWGYNFDWQSRAFFVPAGTPTVVNSGFIGHALLDAYERTGDQRALDLASPIADFMLNDLNRQTEGDTFCFSYTPLDDYSVHNASMLGASLLARLHSIDGRDELLNAAQSALTYTMERQRDDGSWWYSERESSHWVDSFHTGFVLESLRWFLRLGLADQYCEQYERGVRYYAENFFLEDGVPKYYHNKVLPIDIHAPAEAITFFSDEGPQYGDLLDRVTAWMIDNLFSAQGYFYFRKGRWWTNRVPYMRWAQSWAFRALARYLEKQMD